MKIALDIVITLLALLFLGVLVLRFIKNLLVEKEVGSNEVLAHGNGVAPSTMAKVFLWGLGIRVAVYFFGYVFSIFLYKTAANNVLDIFTRWDAGHYIKLIDVGYAGAVENGRHLFLVFFPLFVWIARPFALLLGNTQLAAALVSCVCFAWGCCWVYRIGAHLHGGKIAKFAVIALSVFPFSFFYGCSMTEGLFLLTTAAAIYYAITYQWKKFAVWGMLAALTRMTGVLVIIPAFVEFMEKEKLLIKKNRTHFNWKKGFKTFLILLSPLMGTGIYLLLNYKVDGDFFAFITHQEHWNQGGMWISRVVGYVVEYLKNNYNTPYGIAVWYPTLILFILVSATLTGAYIKKYPRISLLFYGFFYLVANYSLAWLLSAGRYMSTGFIYFIFLGFLFKKHENAKIALIVGQTMLLCLYIAGFIFGEQIM